MTQTLNENATIKVGVVDDVRFIVSSTEDILNNKKGFRTLFTATSGAAALDLLANAPEKPDIIIMDVAMPGMNGIEATRRVHALYPEIKVVAFTVEEEESLLLGMFAAGACAYLLKNITHNDLADALHKINVNEKFHADLFHLNQPKLRGYRSKIKDIVYTERELEFIRYQAKGYSHAEIAKAMNVSIPAIAKYYTSLCEKFGTTTSIAIVVEAIHRGLINVHDLK